MCYLLIECFQYPFEVVLSSYPLSGECPGSEEQRGGVGLPAWVWPHHVDLQALPSLGFCTHALLLRNQDKESSWAFIITGYTFFRVSSCRPSAFSIHWNHPILPCRRARAGRARELARGWKAHCYLRALEAQLVLKVKRNLGTWDTRPDQHKQEAVGKSKVKGRTEQRGPRSLLQQGWTAATHSD